MQVRIEKRAGGVRRVYILARRGTRLSPSVFKGIRDPLDWEAVNERIAEISRAENPLFAERRP